jgi:acyl-CoA thioester hydrolase
MTSTHLAGFPVVIELDVAWAEMDSFAHVNNVVYFRYFENARVDYLTRVGWFALMETEGIGPIVSATNARFRRPVSYPDRLAVGARVVTVEADRVTFEHRIVSRRWGDLACEGQAVVVCYDYRRGCKTPLPASLRERIDRLEQGG